MGDSNLSDEALAELLTLTREVDNQGTITYRNAAGQLHRTHGPATIRTSGLMTWQQNGQLHRVDGPAIIYGDGAESWWLDGQMHRDDGPAETWPDGTEYWWLHGRLIDNNEPPVCP